jgi:bifunctional polynucleotide phosphatase/kinase
MELTWISEPTFVFGYNKSIENYTQTIKSVYLFDLDYTLIKTKSGKKFPISKTDWELLYPNIPEKFANMKDCLVGIISNQKGLKSQSQISDWIEKIVQIRKVLPIDFVFGSLSDDRFRKPMYGSWEYIKNYFVGIDWDNLTELKKIYYIGDAFGRPGDFSDTDVKYALNCGFKFKTPEVFFSIDKSEKTGNITYPIIKYFTPGEQTQLFDKLFETIQTLINFKKKILIITIGLPASGKSFLRKELIKKFDCFAYSNNDDLGQKVQSRMLIKKLSTDHDYLIDDNTNLNKLELNGKLQKFQSYYKIGIWFNYDLEVCWHLNWMRMYWFGGKLLPKVTYYTLNKKFNPTNLSDDFDHWVQIDKVFKEMNLDSKIKYYF